jgi:hypothetical protein
MVKQRKRKRPVAVIKPVQKVLTRKQEYRLYITSSEWKEKASLIKKRDGYKCRFCESEKELNVHHITYASFKSEQPDDLITLCALCHRAAHERRLIVFVFNDQEFDAWCVLGNKMDVFRKNIIAIRKTYATFEYIQSHEFEEEHDDEPE